jgi:YD repeat-containing protein
VKNDEVKLRIGYDATTDNLNYKSDVGTYTYSAAQPHAVTQAGANSYAYDQNGNMISRTVDGVAWTYTYNADGQLIQIRKNNQLVSEYGYDGDGKRVWSKDYEGYPAGELKETIYIGNYFEFVREDEAAGQGEGGVCKGTYCSYLPMIFQMPRGISYYYADGQRIAMRDNDGMVSYLYGDQLGSVSAVADTNGNLVSTTLYEP